MKKIIFTCLIAIVAGRANAQLKGDHILGSAGLKAGSQAPPSLAFAIPLYYYSANSLRSDNGDKLAADLDINMFVTGIGVSWVSDFKILGANYGNSVLLGFAKSRIEGNTIGTETALAFSDMFVQPVQLGWHTKRADYLFTYSLYLPTGKWALGAEDNSGLGMLSNEFAAGATLYLDKKKMTHFSTLLSYEVNGTKKDTEIKTGDLLTIEGGIGRTLYGKGNGMAIPLSVINLGFTYYMQFKTSSDKIPLGSTVFTGDKDRVYAIGAEANLLLTGSRLLFGAKWLTEMGARNRFQGQTFFFTAAYAISTEKKEKK